MEHVEPCKLFKCIGIIKNKQSNIPDYEYYELVNDNGDMLCLSGAELLDLMKSNQIKLANGGINEEGKLKIHCDFTTTYSSVLDSNLAYYLKDSGGLGESVTLEIMNIGSFDKIKNLINRAKAIGMDCTFVKSNMCYILKAPGTITVIGKDFAVLGNLINPVFRLSVKELKFTNFGKFKCSKLDNLFYKLDADILDISSCDFSNIESAMWLFGHTRIGEIRVNKLNFENCTTLAYAFKESRIGNLSDIVKKMTTVNCEDMAGLFEGSTTTGTLDLGNFDTGNCRCMQRMFASVNLDNLVIDNFDTNNVKYTTGMFECAKIGKLDISNWELSKGKSFYNMFKGFETDSLDISKFNATKVETVAKMFYKANIDNLTMGHLDLNDDICNDLGDNMFKFLKCRKLDIRKLGKLDPVLKRAMFLKSEIEEIIE